MCGIDVQYAICVFSHHFHPPHHPSYNHITPHITPHITSHQVAAHLQQHHALYQTKSLAHMLHATVKLREEELSQEFVITLYEVGVYVCMCICFGV